MRIKEKLASFPNELRYLFWAVFALVLFAIAGQITCDHLGTLKGFPYQCITIVLTLSESALLYLVVRALSGKGKIIRILAWIIGVLMFLYMLFMSYVLIFGMPSPLEVYSTGWWIGQVDKLEEEQRLWSVSHWVGHGGSYYEYDDSVVETPAATEAQATEEPYYSALDERARAETAYQYYYADTMLNVLSYLYGRWVWLVYLIIAITWIIMGLRASSLVLEIPSKLLYLASWLLFTIAIGFPALNGCGLRFSYYGPPFTGFFYAYWEYHLLMVGPSLGVMVSLVTQKSRIEKGRVFTVLMINNE